MLKKRKTRELAMQVLFVWDANGADDPEVARRVVEGTDADEDLRRAALEMASAAWKQRETTDAWVERIAPQWPPRRQPGVDRALIRLAVWEMTGGGTPPKVAIDEALELSKLFSTEHSPSFINGVLDAILREQKALTREEGSGFRVPEEGSGTMQEPQSEEHNDSQIPAPPTDEGAAGTSGSPTAPPSLLNPEP